MQREAWCAFGSRVAAAAFILAFAGRAFAQVATTVTVNAGTPIKYANNAVTATIPSTGLGLHTSVYANQWGNSSLPGLIQASGVQMLRYPGGSYSDLYNWSNGTGNNGAYIASHSDFGNFINVMDQSQTQGMVTVNYGSNTTNTIGGQPQEAAAWVAYANASPSLFGTPQDISLGTDAAGINWKTAGYWAKLRASTASQYQTWATAAGEYNPANLFLAINHPAAEGVKYWEIGNEIGGNGYTGVQWEYDLHAPYQNGDTSSNVGRKNNPLLSPSAYGANLMAFSDLMKKVDPTIKVGAGFNAGSTTDSGDTAILTATNASFPGKKASDYIDFGIIHWYPGGSLPGTVTTGSGSLPTEINNLRTVVQNNTSRGSNGIEVNVTEFGYSAANHPAVANALFTADAYITGFENGVKNMDFVEMSSAPYLHDGPLTPGEVYYSIQMLSHFAKTGDTLVSTTYADSALRVHAVKRPDGSMAFLFVNDGLATDSSQDRALTVNMSGGSGLASRGSFYLFGDANVGATVTPPTLQTVNNSGNSLTVTIPDQSMGVVVLAVLPAAAYWKGNADGNWSTFNAGITNWKTDATGATDSNAAPGSPTDVFFTATGGGSNVSTTLDADFSIKGLTFTSAATTPVTIGGSHTLTLGADGLTVQAGAAAPTIASAVTLGTNQTCTVNGGNPLTVSGALSLGGFTLTKTGGGTVRITGAPTLSMGSALHINGGTLQFNVNSGSVTVASGVTANVSGSGTLELAGAVSVLGSTMVANRVNITNTSTAAAGVLVSGGNQQVGNIDGSGATQVNAGNDLTANHIIQGALVIGGTSGSAGLVTIDASDSAGNPLGQSNGLALAGSLTPSDPIGAGGIGSAGLSGDGSELASPPLADSALGGNPSSVPEPSTLVLILFAITGLASQGIALRRLARRSDY